MCYQCAVLIGQNERSAEVAVSDQTVWSTKEIGHAKPAPLQQTKSLFMGFSGAEKVNLLLSLEECSVWVHMRKTRATIAGSTD